jgi:hypothetical protein
MPHDVIFVMTVQFMPYPCPVFSTFPLYQAPNYALLNARVPRIGQFPPLNRAVTVFSRLQKE